jgi:hypothetical protein
MATWENKKFTLKLSTVGQDMVLPKDYTFRFARFPPVGADIFYYTVVPDAGNAPGPNPFEGRSFFPQEGRKLTKYIPDPERLGKEGSDNYEGELQALSEMILVDRVEEDPFGYERLVGFVTTHDNPANPAESTDLPVMFYQLDNTHQDKDTLLVLARVKRFNANPNGTIIVTGRT